MTVNPIFHRIGLLTGNVVLSAFEQTNVLVFGAGGVGSWCAEALARSGIGRIGIIDSDTVCITNINRQIQATTAVIGKPKATLLKTRLLEINPQARVTAWDTFFSRQNALQFNIDNADYVIDAIDSLNHKLDLIELSQKPKLFSCMGAALKLDPTRLKVADIWETRGCPVARIVRAGLRKRGFKGHFNTVYSDEKLPLQIETENPCGKECQMCESPKTINSPGRVINGSAVTVTAVAGMILASMVLRDICAKHGVGSFKQ